MGILFYWEFYKQKGTTYQHSCVYTSKQNGVEELKHCHILESARALHFQAHLPLHFWAECVFTAVHIINRLPTTLLSHQTPFECIYGKLPSYSHLRVFGCLAYTTDVHVPHKFAPQAKRCVFLGYPVGQKAYKLYDLATHQVFTSRDVIFHENIFSYEFTPSTFTNSAPIIPLSIFDPSSSGPLSTVQHTPPTQPILPPAPLELASHSDPISPPTSLSSLDPVQPTPASPSVALVLRHSQ